MNESILVLFQKMKFRLVEWITISIKIRVETEEETVHRNTLIYRKFDISSLLSITDISGLCFNVAVLECQTHRHPFLSVLLWKLLSLLFPYFRQWFSPGTPVSSTNKTDLYDIAEILLKVALNSITIAHTFEVIKFPLYFLVSQPHRLCNACHACLELALSSCN